MLAFTHRYHSIRLSFSLWLFFHLRSYKREVFRFFAAAAAVHCSSSVRLHFFVDNIFTLATHNRNIYRRQFSFVAECVWCCVFFVCACTQIRSNFLHYGFSYKPIHCSCHIKTLGALIIVIIIMIIILNDSLFFPLFLLASVIVFVLLFPSNGMMMVGLVCFFRIVYRWRSDHLLPYIDSACKQWVFCRPDIENM